MILDKSHIEHRTTRTLQTVSKVVLKILSKWTMINQEHGQLYQRQSGVPEGGSPCCFGGMLLGCCGRGGGETPHGGSVAQQVHRDNCHVQESPVHRQCWSHLFESSTWMKHVDVRYHFMWELTEEPNPVVKIEFCCSEDNRADTKNVVIQLFKKHNHPHFKMDWMLCSFPTNRGMNLAIILRHSSVFSVRTSHNAHKPRSVSPSFGLSPVAGKT